MKTTLRICVKIFISSLYISSFTFGGGFVIIPLIKKKFVSELKWIEEQEMLDLVVIGQSSPGSVAVNVSILVGFRVAGIPGAVAAVLGTILPPLVILSAVSFFYQKFRDSKIVAALLKGMQAGVAAVIADVVLKMGYDVLRKKQILPVVIMAGAFAAVYFFKINVVIVICVCICAGILTVLLLKRKKP